MKCFYCNDKIMDNSRTYECLPEDLRSGLMMKVRCSDCYLRHETGERVAVRIYTDFPGQFIYRGLLVNGCQYNHWDGCAWWVDRGDYKDDMKIAERNAPRFRSKTAAKAYINATLGPRRKPTLRGERTLLHELPTSDDGSLGGASCPGSGAGCGGVDNGGEPGVGFADTGAGGRGDEVVKVGEADRTPAAGSDGYSSDSTMIL